MACKKEEGRELLHSPALFFALFTEVRGIGILRSSSNQSSRKFEAFLVD
jgi:hypothetical protein